MTAVDTIHHDDALRVLRSLEPFSVDALISDPPYCSGGFSESQKRQAQNQGFRDGRKLRDGKWFAGDNMGAAGISWLLREVAVEAARVVRPTGSVLLFCDWRMVPHLVPAIESAGLRYQALVVWDKKAIGPGTGFRAQHEFIMHFTCGNPKFHDKGVSNILQYPRVSPRGRKHPTEKPLGLMCDLIRVATPAGGVVLDPFCGSGATLEAARKLGRKFIGVDRDGGFVRVAQDRIDRRCGLL